MECGNSRQKTIVSKGVFSNYYGDGNTTGWLSRRSSQSRKAQKKLLRQKSPSSVPCFPWRSVSLSGLRYPSASAKYDLAWQSFFLFILILSMFFLFVIVNWWANHGKSILTRTKSWSNHRFAALTWFHPHVSSCFPSPSSWFQLELPRLPGSTSQLACRVPAHTCWMGASCFVGLCRGFMSFP